MSRLLSEIDDPRDLRDLSENDLPELCDEIREFLIDRVFRTGGHLATSLGAVEITVALHYVFDFLEDRLIWDVGHQAYTHKILTGRRDRFHTQRSAEGLSGFTNPIESPYDHFMGGHAGTSISTGLGIAFGSALKNEDRKTVIVIGDASIGAGMAFEALNMAGVTGRDMLVVLNDNRMSISQTVGSLAGYLRKIRTMPLYSSMKRDLQAKLGKLPLVGDRLRGALDHVMETMKYYVVPGHIFEELGIKYFGPFDGHDVHAVVRALRDVKRHEGPALLHLVTEKGKGYGEAEADPVKYHGVSKKKPVEKVPGRKNGKKDRPSWTRTFSDALIALAEEDPRVVAISAAMPGGTGTDRFGSRFPDRFFDVGICEQHGVGLAAGLAREGFVPVVAIYSTFLQRAYDQVFHDVCLNGRGVVFCMDRAGIVGEDGWSHHGLYDIAYLRTFPGITLLAPKNGPEFEEMLRWAIGSGEICAIRYPRGAIPPAFGRTLVKPVEVGRAEVLRNGPDGAILAYGGMVHAAWEATRILRRQGVKPTLVNARFANPVDSELILKLAKKQPFLLTLEDASLPGGFGSAVLEALADGASSAIRVTRLGAPAEMHDHSSRGETLSRLGLTPEGVAETVERLLHEKTSHPTWG
ncbi:MAG: 1-deoxy-D-xylulose-5-phosphate synthase [Planctomycetota bacterium]|jgi:1-deoxy-D-xylulose-5-phosphate synthase